MRRYIYPLSVLLLMLMLVGMGYYVHAQVQAIPAWDGTYTCAPGTTYTTEECK